jgi:hypothetical protein
MSKIGPQLWNQGWSNLRTWYPFESSQSTVRKYEEELRLLGHSLGEALYFMKMRLTRPGRNGEWSEFLRQKEIPTRSADRLVGAYERSLHLAAHRTDGVVNPPQRKK